MDKKQKAAKKAPVVKKEDKKKEISDKDLDQVNGGVRPQPQPPSRSM